MSNEQLMKKIKVSCLLTMFFLIGCDKKNELTLNFSEPLEKKDFKIELQALGGGKISSKIFDGKNQYTILNEYGENDWLFIYKDSLYAKFRHFKTNRNDTHDYNFRFFKKETTIFIEVDIKGISTLKKAIEFSSKTD